MSHLKEREEKVCLNCNAAIYGRFCHVCGQENLEPKESFGHLVTHFLFDLIHFDGKFFSTIKYLLFKPGFLDGEHARGRRADYLHPISLYIFVSAFFFLIMFSFYGEEHQSKKEYFETTIKKLEKRKVAISNAIIYDSLSLEQKKTAFSFIATLDSDISNFKIDSSRSTVFLSKKLDYRKIFPNEEIEFNVQFGFLENYLEKKQKNYATKEAFNKKFLETLIHSIPKGLFIALPFYALFLMLFYVRNKKYNYVSHLLFSIYLFSFNFILILCSTWLISLFNLFSIDTEGWIFFVAFFTAMLYTYKGLRNYYKQSRTKTILKFLLLSISCLIIMLVITLLLFIYTVQTV